MKLMKRLIHEEKGQGLVEYALILALIALVCVGAMAALGTSINALWTEVGS